MQIDTRRLIVRTFREEDADALFRIKTDPQVLEYCPDLLAVDARREDMPGFIRTFRRIEETGDMDAWRCYAIEERQTGAVVGCLTFSRSSLLHEFELGWMMIGAYAKNGYASEAAAAFAEAFCLKHGVDYLIAVMDVDNPASRRTAEKARFRLFEKRTVYDWSYGRYCDDYYYFRRYSSACTLRERFYGDVPYLGRSTSDPRD